MIKDETGYYFKKIYINLKNHAMIIKNTNI